MKKILVCIVLMLLLTGCKVEYKINLNNELDIEENIKLISTTEYDKTELDKFNINIPINKNIDDYSFFEKKQKDIEYYNLKKDEKQISIKYKYNKDEHDKYIDSTLINNAYKYISLSITEDKHLVLSTSKEFLLFEKYKNLEEVKITISTTYKVLKDNADNIENHDYTWIITKDNAYGKNIYLKLDATKEDLTFTEKLLRGDYLNIFTISIIIFIFGYLIYILLKRKSQIVNKI